MNHNKHEKGQTLIIIALAAIVLIGFTALAIDGSMVFSDRRHAQNAADTAAMAGALAYARGSDLFTTAQTRATSNGYDNDTITNIVIVTVLDSPSGVCPAHTQGKDIQVDITSYVQTTFARVIGRTQVTNAVTATSRTCGSYSGPPFNGNAIVSLAPSGVGYDGTGNPYWLIEGGGIFSNSLSPNAAYCNGSATINAPSVTVVGNTISQDAMPILGQKSRARVSTPTLIIQVYSLVNQPVMELPMNQVDNGIPRPARTGAASR